MYSSLMRGKSGQWGIPFTKGNANAMRLRGLDIRRRNSVKRLARVLCEGQPTKWEMRETRPGVYVQVVTDSTALRAERARQPQLAGPGPSQPSKPPRSDAAEPSPAAGAKLPRADGAPVPGPQAGGIVCYGYELAPGVWQEAGSPAPQPNGRIAAAEAAACARQSVRRR